MADKKGNFQLYALTWVGILDPDIYHYAFPSGQSPPRGANRGGTGTPRSAGWWRRADGNRCGK